MDNIEYENHFVLTCHFFPARKNETLPLRCLNSPNEAKSFLLMMSENTYKLRVILSNQKFIVI